MLWGLCLKIYIQLRQEKNIMQSKTRYLRPMVKVKSALQFGCSDLDTKNQPTKPQIFRGFICISKRVKKQSRFFILLKKQVKFRLLCLNLTLLSLFCFLTVGGRTCNRNKCTHQHRVLKQKNIAVIYMLLVFIMPFLEGPVWHEMAIRPDLHQTPTPTPI